MSDINIKSEKDLMKFLRIVAQESYNKSLTESYEENFKNQFDLDTERFGKLSVSSKKKLDEEEDDMIEPGNDSGEELISEPDETQEDEDSGPIDNEEEAMTTVSFDSVIDRINTLRAGRSTKDKEIKKSLEDYYNKLDENERIVLKIFLEELSEILGGEIEGANAKDPSDPPDSFKITSGEEAADEEVAADVEKQAPGSSDEDEDMFGDEEGQEDTSPPEDLPIKMNEKRSDWELRMKIRELMER